MRRWLARAAGALAAFAALAPAAGLGADPPSADLRLGKLTINADARSWYAEPEFRVAWEPVTAAEPSPITSVGFRLLDEGGTELIADRVGAGAAWADLTVRAGGDRRVRPGLYRVEVWLNTESGRGPASAETFRFDDRAPGPAAPQLAARWFRGGAEPVLRISHPPVPLPLSGIGGYAIALRRDSAAPPCAGPDRCTEAETDLDGGIGDDTLPLGALAEGRYLLSAVAVSGAGVRSAVVETAELGIDATLPDLALEGAGGGWSNRPVRVVARATDRLSGMLPTGPTGPQTSLAVDGGAPSVGAGGEVAVIVDGDGLHGIAAGARDAAGNARGPEGDGAPVTGFVRIDQTAPTVAFAAADPAAPELIEATVADPLSGPAPRGSIALRPLGPGHAFEPLPTSVANGRLTARWDSDSYPDGSYEFRATGYDLAGNAASSTRRLGGAPMLLRNPVKARPTVQFGFGGRQLIWPRCTRRGETRRCQREVIGPFGRRPARRVVPYGRGLQVGGRLLSAAGAPLAGAAVELVEEFPPGALLASRATALRTAADGSFLARLAPGPSRRVRARFNGTPVLARAASRELRLGVQARLRLRASSAAASVGGAPVLFSGRVGARDAAIPAYGRPVQLQFRLPGSAWTEFRTVQTDAAGRFHYPYSFTDDDSRGVRFLFRAYTPPQPGWPYEPAASRPVAVTGY